MSKPEAETVSMAPLVASLCNSFQQVPPSAVPAMLDCILLSTGSSPHSLFASLLHHFLPLLEDISKEGDNLDSDKLLHLQSLWATFCHLLKKIGDNFDALQSFIWRCFLPLAKALQASQHGLLNQITESFIDVVIQTRTWEVLKASFVPIFLRSIGLSMGMLHNGDLDFYEWSSKSFCQGSYDVATDPLIKKELVLSSSINFTLPTSCNVLCVILEAALHFLQTDPICKSSEEKGRFADNFVKSLIWELCNMIERMLLQSSEHRSCGVGFLLPIVLKAFPTKSSFEVSIRGQKHVFSWEHFFIKMWNCCRTLLSTGPLERREAFNVLSLYLPFSLSTKECRNAVEDFDIRAEKEFWDEIRMGLVDKESLVRKQSLHILKMSLNLQEGTNSMPSILKQDTEGEHSVPHGVTKREQWAYKEAKSLGVGKISTSDDLIFDNQQYWEAFVLLYEMLEEYGTHLVEAAWNHQVSLLLQFSGSCVRSNSSKVHENQVEIYGETFIWLSILWERGLHHDNPQVRCLIMQSFLDINWDNYGNYINSVPETFVLGPFLQGLNDPIHHKEFGVKGVYMSKVIEGAARFLHHYVNFLDPRKHIAFLCNLASTAKHQSFGRAGLMGLAKCIASAANGIGRLILARTKSCKGTFPVEFVSGVANPMDKKELLDVFRYVVESSKQHFNPSYRLQVCDKILEAAISVVCTFDIPLEILLLFISAFPREFTDYGGQLRVTVQRWLSGFCYKDSCANCCSNEMKLWNCLYDFPHSFVNNHLSNDASLNYDDDDLSAWEFEANRWARVLFLAIKENHPLEPILMFVQRNGPNILEQNHDTRYIAVKFLILAMSLVLELHRIKERVIEYGNKARKSAFPGIVDDLSLIGGVSEKLVDKYLYLLDDLVQFANQSCSIFWSDVIAENTALPGAVKGKLGGPSQRRLSISATTAVLQAIMSVKAISSILTFCKQVKSDAPCKSALTFLWKFFWRTTGSPASCSEIGAEICLASYEALVSVLRVLASTNFHQSLHLIEENEQLLSVMDSMPQLDSMFASFIQNINDLLGTRVLARSRRAVLLDIKWACLESLLSIPSYTLKSGFHLVENHTFFSDGTLRCIFNDLVQSLENAGESSVLPMLRSLRMLIELVGKVMSTEVISQSHVIDTQMMWNLVRSSWILHISCKKRRVASIAALLSSVLHPLVFNDEHMHQTDNGPGPLKWFIENILQEGTKSPRTIRLAALHLTGLWLLNPRIIKFYMKELKLLSLYGSVAFDEDFEAELADNNDARLEVSILAMSPDSELTEAFINTELYARVSVAVLFHKLADLASMVGLPNEDANGIAALKSGKLFLLELLDSAVNDKDLVKELYKKYSAIHRRKIRAWQIICVLSPFVDKDIVEKVVDYLYTSLNRNNLPAVRQYLETFAINMYLKFPSLVKEQLVPILRDYDTKQQALSSYVFIAANVILNSSKDVQSRHLDELFPPLVPLLTSHHHSLRGFTQLLVYQILLKLFPLLDSCFTEMLPLEKRCFLDLKMYLEKNSDCARLRASMVGYLDAYNPNTSATPAGIFVNRVEEVDFECVPTSLMEQLLKFLNDAREELRSSMAKDVLTIRNETLKFNGDKSCMESFSGGIEGAMPKDMPSDFQKKVTLTKHDKGDAEAEIRFRNDETYRKMAEIERDDLLLDQMLQSRRSSLDRLKASRQNIILVASLLDRIPNLAGLARTCEVFRASGLAIADTSIISDKQFQLISVTAEKWVPITEVPVDSLKVYLQKKKREGFSILGLEQTANSVPLDQYNFPKKTVLVLGREKEGIPVDIIHILDDCIEIPQFGVVRSLNVHVSGAIALWEYTRQQRSQ
ncbi:putative tRNA (guanosine(18)-2'-O)-methyltransferase [Lupinus albus]|uniref:tRNA (guanosine(18)-2'-O)-methyltransferase TARBP1 n=1 Tax=Lupinus albus TaxID=3870 RepID=A0A6A4Q0E1_LUPAL|nr:putative tRNA (guanosine(18)-2'-O)-methyltransferase [Lupinus albus]